MKTSIFALSLIAISIITKAQVPANTIFLGGGVMFTKVNNVESMYDETAAEETEFHAFPSIGYTISPSFAIGILGDLSTRKRVSRGDDIVFKSRSNGIGMFTRYYKTLGESDFTFIIQASALYSKVKFDMEYSDYDEKRFQISLTPGVAYFFSSRWSAEFLLKGISYTKAKHTDDIKSVDGKKLEIGIDSFFPQLGIRFYCSKNK
jgi:hypothetical protein